MRTTITLTPEAQALVDRAMRERGASFKHVVNEAIVRALRRNNVAEPYVMPTWDFGSPSPTPEEMHRMDEEDEVLKYERLARGLGGSDASD